MMVSGEDCPFQILLVEDTIADAKLFFKSFEVQHFNVKIEWAKNAELAIEFLSRYKREGSEQKIDLVVLDLNLPKVKGLELISFVRKHKDLSVLPILVLSSSSADEEVFKSYSLGANAYIVKPVDFDSLQQVAKSIYDFWFRSVCLPHFERPS